MRNVFVFFLVARSVYVCLCFCVMRCEMRTKNSIAGRVNVSARACYACANPHVNCTRTEWRTRILDHRDVARAGSVIELAWMALATPLCRPSDRSTDEPPSRTIRKIMFHAVECRRRRRALHEPLAPRPLKASFVLSSTSERRRQRQRRRRRRQPNRV